MRNCSIPKKVHYCWFGHGKMSKNMQECLESWQKYLYDYEIIEWNESNFDFSDNLFATQAYENKKYAFVADYARAKLLYEYGGIYMDTDILVLKGFDFDVNAKGFIGFDMDIQYVNTGLIACESKLDIIQKHLEQFSGRKFVKDDGTFDDRTNVGILTELLKEYGFETNGKMQVINDFRIFPAEYFSPTDFLKVNKNFTNNTYAHHRHEGSWLTKQQKFRQKIEWLKYKFINIIGYKR